MFIEKLISYHMFAGTGISRAPPFFSGIEMLYYSLPRKLGSKPVSSQALLVKEGPFSRCCQYSLFQDV